jgi:hypothetical protein
MSDSKDVPDLIALCPIRSSIAAGQILRHLLRVRHCGHSSSYAPQKLPHRFYIGPSSLTFCVRQCKSQHLEQLAHLTPCAQKGTKKKKEKFFICFFQGQVFGSPCS